MIGKITHLKKLEQGKQGCVGLLIISENNIDTFYVYKISKYMNFLVDHEATVMEGFNDLHPACPNFCKLYKKVSHLFFCFLRFFFFIFKFIL